MQCCRFAVGHPMVSRSFSDTQGYLGSFEGEDCDPTTPLHRGRQHKTWRNEQHQSPVEHPRNHLRLTRETPPNLGFPLSRT